MADYLTGTVSWMLVILLAIIPGDEAYGPSFCFTDDSLVNSDVYCHKGCCNSFTSDPCCYPYDWSGVYWGVGVSVVAVITLVVGLSIYCCCCRKQQRAAGTIINGTPATVINGQPAMVYTNNGLQTSYIQPGIVYPQTGYYPSAGQPQAYYLSQPTSQPTAQTTDVTKATAENPPAYDSLDKSATNGVNNAGCKPASF